VCLRSFIAVAAYWLPFVASTRIRASGEINEQERKDRNLSAAKGHSTNSPPDLIIPAPAGNNSISMLGPRRLSYRKPVSFYVMGDAPYSSSERDRFPDQVKNVPSDAEFMIHVGDMKGVDTCQSDRPYELVSDAFLENSVMPVFLVPGDNDYYDCDDWRTGWNKWSSFFLYFHQKFRRGWVSSVNHQLGREENFSFKRRGILFVGVHMVGTGRGIKNQKKWKALLSDDLEWTREQVTSLEHKVVVIFSHAGRTPDHDIFFDGLSELAKESGRPFLFIHGDTHRWQEDQPFAAKNILRVVVDQGGIADPLKVTIDLNGEKPDISFKRRPLSN